MKSWINISIISLLIFSCDNSTEPEGCTDVEDIDGNCYTTVQIGSQLWMAENLKTISYNNGDDIVTGIDNASAT